LSHKRAAGTSASDIGTPGRKTQMRNGAWFTSPTHRVGMNRVEHPPAVPGAYCVLIPGGAGGLLRAHPPAVPGAYCVLIPGGGEPCPKWGASGLIRPDWRGADGGRAVGGAWPGLSG
jgi:hypothetical protein